MQLLRTAQEVTTATVFARFADKRDVMGSAPASIYALTHVDHRGPVRVDFTADTGDGFDATFAIARLLASGLPTEAAGQPDQPAGPADLLVLGGDQVYPVASFDAYRQRFTSVFSAARHWYYSQHHKADPPDHGPPVLALPGNHDWYDGLSAFRRTFCESWTRMADEIDNRGLTKVGAYESAAGTGQREVAGGWTTVQSRSYFAIRVHPKWWIWGVDSQLNAPIDPAQLAYFDAAKSKLDDDVGVVLCSSTPTWLEADGASPPEFVRETPLTTMVDFARRYLGHPEDKRLRMILTGDKHHYALYVPDPAEEQPTNEQPVDERTVDEQPVGEQAPEDKSLNWMPGPVLVTCGGGGAFTSPTHHLKQRLSVPWERQKRNVSRPVTRYDRSTVYPSVDESKAMRKQIWKMGGRNGPLFPALIGVLLTCVFWTMAGARVLHWPSAIACIVLAVITCTYALTGIRGQKGSPPGARAGKVLLAGILHAAVHLAAIVLVLWLVRGLFNVSGRPWWLLPAVYVPFVVLGTLVFTLYLFVCDWRGYHETEAFASTRSERYKCLLRLTFEDAKVTVEAVGLDQVPPAHQPSVPISEMPLHPRRIDYFEVPRTGPRINRPPN